MSQVNVDKYYNVECQHIKCIYIVYYSTDQMLLCTISNFLSIWKLVVYLFMKFVISNHLKLALIVVMDVFCDVDCVKYKMCMVLDFISDDCHIEVFKVNIKAKIMNAYFQHLLYYKSKRKDLKH